MLIYLLMHCYYLLILLITMNYNEQLYFSELYPPSRISTPGGVQGKPGGLLKTPATRPTDCSLCCPQDDVSAASDPALAD